MVNIDEIDIKIINLIYDKQDIYTSQIAKNIFNPPNDYELKKKDMFIRTRIRKLIGYNIMSIDDEGNYILNQCKKTKTHIQLMIQNKTWHIPL